MSNQNKSSSQETPEIVAAVDLGSNSFHMIVSSLNDGKLQTLDRIREMVRLASGLDENNYLNETTQNKAIACLERFGQRIRNMPASSVRVVGTNTLRTAKNAGEFLSRAEQALGHPVHIISGVEEARLIYQGVAHSLESNAKRRFVMDIGGGSTEYIIGTNDEPRRKESVNMGCVTLSNLFFTDGKISRKRFEQAVFHAEQKLEPLEMSFNKTRWDEAIGASGSLRAINKVLMATGWSNNGITREGLEKLVDHVCTQKHSENLNLPDLNPQRSPVFPGGLAIIYATCKTLGIEQMTVSDGALREGLIYDLLGRIFNNDIRSDTVKTLAEHYHVDRVHATRIQQTIKYMLNQLDASSAGDKKSIVQFLDWTAMLHEIGHDIAHNQYHKHGAYIVENADLAGFSRQDQKLLSILIRSHRRKLPLKEFAVLPAPWNKDIPYLAIVLRIAVLLHRNRHDVVLPAFNISLDPDHIQLEFPPGWLTSVPLTRADLQQEADYLESAGFKLELS